MRYDLTPTRAAMMRCKRRVRPGGSLRPRGGLLAFLLSLVAAACAPAGAQATPQQAPNSRVVLDLPQGYVPSPLFSGFQDESRGVSLVILEAPASEYEKMLAGFTPQELAKRDIKDVRQVPLGRTDRHIYMRGTQTSAAGTYAKFFVLFRTHDQTILVSANVPQKALEDRSVTPEEIEKILASARTTETPAVRDLFALNYLGPFKEAGTLVGTSKLYTLDGRLEPERAGETRSAFMVAPSLDKRPIKDPDGLAVALLAKLAGYKNVKVGEPKDVTIAGLDGVEVTADAIDEDDDTPVHLYQAMLLGKDGGYFRLIGIATPKDATRLAAEFPKIAQSFVLLP